MKCHIRNMHADLKGQRQILQCKDCNFNTKHTDKLGNHMARVHGKGNIFKWDWFPQTEAVDNPAVMPTRSDSDELNDKIKSAKCPCMDPTPNRPLTNRGLLDNLKREMKFYETNGITWHGILVSTWKNTRNVYTTYLTVSTAAKYI